MINLSINIGIGSGSSLDPTQNLASPYYLHPNENPALVLVTPALNGLNYHYHTGQELYGWLSVQEQAPALFPWKTIAATSTHIIDPNSSSFPSNSFPTTSDSSSTLTAPTRTSSRPHKTPTYLQDYYCSSFTTSASSFSSGYTDCKPTSTLMDRNAKLSLDTAHRVLRYIKSAPA
ncbi:uncharacterized protein LOC129301070 [Prosopis cineraria]|uniref:uncharacterized protein LOC129301070 n=1 Tax=Prosopis cineraria TaxID=364024 RepID=UPI0024107EBF|nr:uncharacterized protein LOC129301070 [Prosopis cineraria]